MDWKQRGSIMRLRTIVTPTTSRHHSQYGDIAHQLIVNSQSTSQEDGAGDALPNDVGQCAYLCP